ncbi:MAG: S-layer homology domain-containing protein [Clostridia bacterium]|nr:S-layer homology domain-containing protein [Clostridia bacterium]MCI9086644.1 S-layer homology domain-containing protein [Clostridia bacterium]
MKKVMKKLMLMSIAFILIMLSIVPIVMAASDRAIFDVQSLGIIEGDENGELNLDTEVTRAEFAKIIVTLMGYENASAGASSFPDVAKDTWYAPYVSLAKDLGYVDGYTDNTFRPEKPVLLRDAVKILVSAMNFGAWAEQRGGYPKGYISVAIEQNFLKNITSDVNSNAIRDDIVTLIYNVLDVDMPEMEYGINTSYQIKSGNTIRSKLSKDNDIYNKRGIVTADYDIWLVKPYSGIEKGEIEIEDTIYTLGSDVDTSQYIGRSVEIYYKDNDYTGKKEVTSIAFTQENSELKFDAKDFKELKNNTVWYYDSSNRSVKAQLAEGYVTIYNNRVLGSMDESDFEIENGRYMLIDNNDDNRYEYVFIEEEDNVLVDRVFETGEIYFKNGFTLDGERYITLDIDEPETYRLMNIDGEEIELTEVKENNVLSVIRSRENDIAKIIVSDKTVTGKIENVSSDKTVKIDGTEYDTEKGLEITTGENVTAYLSYNDVIVFTEQAADDTNKHYGYIVSAGLDDNPDNAYVRMIVAGTVENKEETNLENLDDKNKIPVLYCQNEDYTVFKFSGKITVKDTYGKKRISAEQFSENPVTGPVLFTANDDILKSIEIPELVGGQPGREITYNAKELVFGSSQYGGFGIDSKTKVVCVPQNSGASGDDYLVQVKLDNRDAAIKFNAQGYILDEYTNNVKLMVVSREMDSSSIASTNYKTSKTGIVEEIAEFYDEELDEVVLDMKIIESDGEKSYYSKEISRVGEILKTLEEGDLIYFELDVNDRVQSASRVANMKEISEGYGSWSTATELESLYGEALELKLNVIDAIKQRRVDEITLNAADEIKLIQVPKRNAPTVYLYDRDTDEYSVSTTANIREDNDGVYIWQPYGEPKIIVIIR